MHCSLYNISTASSLRGLQSKRPLDLRSFPLPHAFQKSVYSEVIAGMQHNNHGGVIHACPICLCFIKVNVCAPSNVYFSTIATYISSCSFMYLCYFCYRDACLKSQRVARGSEDLTQHTIFYMKTEETFNILKNLIKVIFYRKKCIPSQFLASLVFYSNKIFVFSAETKRLKYQPEQILDTAMYNSVILYQR